MSIGNLHNKCKSLIYKSLDIQIGLDLSPIQSIKSLAVWRNWYTQQILNLPVWETLWVQVPPPPPNMGGLGKMGKVAVARNNRDADPQSVPAYFITNIGNGFTLMNRCQI